MISVKDFAFSNPSLRVRSRAVLATRTELGNSPGDGHRRDGKGLRDHRRAAGHERKRRGGRSLGWRPHDQGREEGGEGGEEEGGEEEGEEEEEGLLSLRAPLRIVRAPHADS